MKRPPLGLRVLFPFLPLLFAAAAAAQDERPYVTNGPVHRVVFDAEDARLGAYLDRGAVTAVYDYVSFVVAHVDERALGGRQAFLGQGFDVVDYMGVVGFNDAALDTADSEGLAATLAAIPQELRGDEDAARPGRKLRVVQFAGPIKDAWLDRLAATGAAVVTYMASNAYVVSVDDGASAAFARFVAEPFVAWSGAYRPWFKISPDLRAEAAAGVGQVTATVQLLADRDAAFVLEAALAAFEQVRPAEESPPYVNLHLRLPASDVRALATHPSVFAIERLYPARLFDEAQGQIVAGNLNAAGTAPSGTGYLAWLAAKGFQQSGQFAFAVDVTDDGVDRGSTTDVNVEFKVGGVASGASRVVYNNNYTGDALADGGGGHGNINASIIGGYNALTGTAAEDASGYNYGLGICPFVNLGNTKVFSNGAAAGFTAGASTRLNAAYVGGARISSNSWGYTSGNNYNADTQTHDNLVRDAQSGVGGNQQLVIVFAAGNSGSGANTVAPPATGKNIICVGASENVRQTGTDGCGIANSGANSAMDVIAFSSRGPTSDGRKKPDIMAPGTHVQGAASRSLVYNGSGVCNQYWPSGQTLYCWSSGTSHSTPAIAGAAALTRQYFLNQGWGTPSPAMTKAAMMTTTRRLTGVGANDTLYSNNQGMGLVDLGRLFDGGASLRVDQSQVLGATGATYTTTGSVGSSAAPFRVGLAWTDKSGATTGNAWVNDLNLTVTVGGQTYKGNVFSGGSSITGGVADNKNNAEFVFLPAGVSGAFTITVTAANIAGDGVPGNTDTTDQDFALFVYNGSGVATPDFSINASPTTATVGLGASTNYTLTSAPTGGFSSAITYSASPAITGVTYGFSVNPAAAGASTVLTATTSASTPPGTYTVTVTGVGGGLTRTRNVTMIVSGPDFSLTASPTTRTITQGAATTYVVTVNGVGGFTGPVTLTTSAAPTGATYTWSANPVAAGGASTLTVQTSAATPASVYQITATGTAGALVRTVTMTLLVTSAGLGTQVKTNGASPNLAIPDNSATGASSVVNFTTSQTISSVSVAVNVAHTYVGDLVVTLTGPSGLQRILHNRTGGSADNLVTTYAIETTPNQSLSGFVGLNTAGAWTLKVQDLAAADTGALVSWSITFNGEGTASPNVAIPDNNATGVASSIAINSSGTVAAVLVKVAVTHPYVGDLVATLIHPDGTQVVLHAQTGGSADDIATVYPTLTAPAQSLTALNGKATAGTWQLKLQDLAAADTGTLVSWTLSVRVANAP